MANEVIDLTACPPSTPPPPRPSKTTKTLKFITSTSSKKIRFKIKKGSRRSKAQKPNPNYISQQVAQWVLRDPYGQTYDFFQAQAQAQAQAAAVCEPDVALPNTFLLPQGTKIGEPWTPKEHEQFQMGLLNYGKGHSTKTAWHFTWNKTPQVQSYARSFFRQLSATCLYSFRKKNSTSATFITSEDLIVASASASDSNPMMMEEDMGLPPTLMLFPDREVSNSTSASKGLEMKLIDGGATTSMATDGDVDLELRLGLALKLTS